MTDHLDEETLNLHFDGELEASHAAVAQRHLDGCAECGKRFVALERLRDLVLLSAETSAEGVDFERVFGQVEREVQARPPLPLFERMRTLVSELLEHRPMQVLVPAMGVAAAVAFFVVSTRPGASPSAPVATERSAPQAAREGRDPGIEREPMMLAAKLESEVVQVDFGENSGTVFEIALADGASTPVVWINDEE